MTREEMTAVLGELTEISSSLKDVLRQFVQQHMEFHELLAMLEQKGLITAVELDKIVSQPAAARPETSRQCRQRRTSLYDRC